MATQTEVQNTLLAASLKVANLVNTNGTILSSGGLTVQWGYINLVQRAINCVQRQYNLGDYVSDPFIIAYNRLLNFVGIDTGGSINPNAQGGGTVINVPSTDGAFNLEYDQTFLIDADPPNGLWYLPLIDPTTSATLPSNYKPTLVTVNGASFSTTYDTNFSPYRLYGFPSNSGTQIIIVTFITT